MGVAKPSKKVFLYMDVYERIRSDILSGALKPEEKLISEDDMALKYHVSRITIKKALELLKEDGFIDRVQGRGTFVRATRPSESGKRRGASAPENLVGVVLEHVTSPFGLGMLYQMDQLLNRAGYTLLIRFSYGDVEKETQEINNLLSMGIRALITMPCHNSYYSMTILKLILEKFPVILVDKHMYGLPVPSVCTDGMGAVFDLIMHLKERGCKNAALISMDPASTTSLSDRVNGFYNGLKASGLECAGECILPARKENLLSSAQDAEFLAKMESFLESFDVLPDALVMTEYHLAQLLTEVCVRRGLAVGRDFKACCIDEDDQASGGYLFTHMRQDENTIAARVVEILIKLISGEEVSSEPVRVAAIFRQGRTT